MIDAAEIYGQASRATFFSSLLSYKNPSLKEASLFGAFGEFTPNSGSTEIRIDKGLLERFERGTASNILLDATVLHELIHYLDDQNGKDYLGEEGELWEKASYGKVIYN